MTNIYLIHLDYVFSSTSRQWATCGSVIHDMITFIKNMSFTKYVNGEVVQCGQTGRRSGTLADEP